MHQTTVVSLARCIELGGKPEVYRCSRAGGSQRPSKAAAEAGAGYAARVEKGGLVPVEAFKPVVLCRRPPNPALKRTRRERRRALLASRRRAA